MMGAKKKTTKARIIRLLGAAIVAGLLVGCVNPFNGNDDSQDAAANGSGSVQVLLGTVGASSIIPDVATTVNAHRVTLSRDGYADITQTGAAGSNGSGTITLTNVPVGSWDVFVEALDTDQDPNAVVGSSDGSHTISVTNGVSASVGPISVAPTTGGTGALDLTISWPADEVTGIAEDSLTLLDSSTLDISLTLTGSPTTGATYTNASLGSGSYTLLLRLERDDGSGPVNVATIIEAIHIYDNVTTEGTITLTGSDIAQPPAAPTDLTATVSSTSGSDTIDLGWTDNSNTETGFEVERSDDGGTTWSGVTTEAANAVTYIDAGLGGGTTYQYRIRSENSFGVSSWSAVDSATTEFSSLHVASTGSDTTGDGSASAPFATIQHAIDQAVTGQEVRVAKGTYTVTFPGIEMKEGVSLYGGYEDSSTTWDRDISKNATIIEDTSPAEPTAGDYDYTWSGGTLSHGYNNPTTAVRFFDGITASTVLDGFIIRGTTNISRPTYGGVILIYDSSPTITNNSAYGADAQTGSYVIQAYEGAAPTVDGNVLTGGNVNSTSSSTDSLVVQGWQASPIFVNNELNGGTSTGTAPGVSTGVVQVGGTGSLWTFRANTIESGESDNYLGGTVRIVSAEGIFDKNHILHSTDANNNNGQVFDLNRSDVVISNNLIETTTTGDDSFRLFFVFGSQADIVSNTVISTNDSTQSFNDGIYVQKYGSTTFSTAIVRNNLFYTDGTSSSYEPIYVETDSTATVENNFLTALDTDYSSHAYFGGGGNGTTQYTSNAQLNFVDFSGGDYRLGTNAVKILRGGGQNLSDDGYGSYVESDYDGDNRSLGYNGSSAGTVSNANAEGWSMGAFEQDG
jgi:hypothetical protein